MPRRNAPFGRHAIRYRPETEKISEQDYKECSEYVLDYVISLVKDEEAAKDLVGDAFVDYLKGLKRVNNADELRALLYTICHNKAINYLKFGSGFKNKRELNVEDPSILLEYPDFNEQLLRDEIMDGNREGVRKALKHMPAGQRNIIELMLFDELDTRAVSHKLGIPYWNVAAAKSRGLAWLRRYFNGIFLLAIWINGC